jgi:hypothetical protein
MVPDAVREAPAASAADDESASAPVRAISFWGRVARAGRVAFVRFRFLVILGIIGAVVAQWDLLRNVWDSWTRAATGVDLATQPVSADTEYFCPMDPGVLSDWPSKCPICNMTLVRRKRGDATPLPEGVVARMQLTPYRLQLGGIRTTPVAYRPLARELDGPGHVLSASDGEARARVALDLFRAEADGLAAGQQARVLGSGPEPLAGTVVEVKENQDDELVIGLIVQVDDPERRLRPGMSVRSVVAVPATALGPFRALPRDPPPLRPGERRRVYVCAEHPEVVADRPGRCPKDQSALMRRDLADGERLRWWCPMHPAVVADEPGAECRDCGGMRLVLRIIAFSPPGEVLAVPESAVIDTGRQTIVYVERMPGMFDGVEVVLGPRCGDAYPVLRGLEAGQRVVAAGAFLVDAETRLNPSLAASYFGAGPRASSAAETRAPDDGLTAEDRAWIARQGTCPVTGKPLGSMGVPARLEVGGRTVYLCCAGCEDAVRADPAKYLGRLPPDATRAP